MLKVLDQAQMVVANPLWRAPRIHGELKMLGIAISERTVSRLLPALRRRSEPDLEDLPAQPYRPNGIHRFLYGADHHDEGIIRISRPGTQSSQGLAFHVTEHPTGAWTAQ